MRISVSLVPYMYLRCLTTESNVDKDVDCFPLGYVERYTFIMVKRAFDSRNGDIVARQMSAAQNPLDCATLLPVILLQVSIVIS